MAVTPYTHPFVQLIQGTAEKSGRTLPSLSQFAPLEAFKFPNPKALESRAATPGT